MPRHGAIPHVAAAAGRQLPLWCFPMLTVRFPGAGALSPKQPAHRTPSDDDIPQQYVP